MPPPFDGPPTFEEPRGTARAWITRPAGIVFSSCEGAFVDGATVKWLTSVVENAMRAAGTRQGVGSYRFVHDWRGVVRHDAEARMLLVGWGLSFARGEIVRIDALPPRQATPMLHMAIAAGRLAMIAAGITMEVVEDPVAALAGLEVDVSR